MARRRDWGDDDRDIRRPRYRHDDDDDFDPRPDSELRRRRSDSGNGLMIGLLIGVPVLLIVLVIGIIVIVSANAEPEPPMIVFNPQVNWPPNLQQPNFQIPELPQPKPIELPKVVVKPPPPKGTPGKPMINLVSYIDPAKDAVENRRWLIKNNELHCDDAHFVPRIEIPYRPPEEYDFIVTFSQPGLRNGISLIMPKPQGGGSFFWYLGASDGSEYGFASNPNIMGQQPGLTQANTAYTTTVQVRKNSVKGLLNGKELINHPTNFADLTCDDWRRIRDTSLLGLACDDPTVFHYVRVVEITGKGKRSR